MDGTQNLPQASEGDASQGHPKYLAKQVAKPLFEAALIRLGCAGTHAEVTTLFNGAASFAQIRDWRLGRRKVPLWAWNYLGVLLDQNIAATASVRASIANPPDIAPGRGAGREIAVWNARRAALKEKASESAGPKIKNDSVD